MTATIVLSIVLPILGGAVWLALRARQPARAADTRGIALQTVIIIVVLLAIAGAVAGVLLTRGSEATSQLEQTDVVRAASEYNNATLCRAAGFVPYKTGTGTTKMDDTDEASLFVVCKES